MAISGNLRTMPFGDLLQWISLSQKTGTLVIKGHRFTKKILFQRGLVVAVTSNNPREHLGYYLVGWELLTEEELRSLLERQQQEKMVLGDLLVKHGRMTQDEVEYIIRVKTEETIFDLMMWNEGEFFFLDDEGPRREINGLNLPVDHFLFEGARQCDERRRIAEFIPDGQYIATVVQPIDESELSAPHLTILRMIDGARTIEQVALKCRMPTFVALSFIYRGVVSKVIALTKPADHPSAVPGFGHTTWKDDLREADNSVTLGDLYEAYRQVGATREKYVGIREALEESDAIERRIVQELEDTVLNSAVILELAVSSRDMVNLSCAPEEAFVLSRIDGVYTLPQVLSQLPGPRLRNQLILHGLMQRGIVKIQESRALGKYQTPTKSAV